MDNYNGPYEGDTITIPEGATSVSAYNGLYGCACGCGGDYAYLHLNGIEGRMREVSDVSPHRFMRRLNRINRAIREGDEVTVAINPNTDGSCQYIFSVQTGYTGRSWTGSEEGRVTRVYFTVPAPKEGN
jgi:hypothetical protein